MVFEIEPLTVIFDPAEEGGFTAYIAEVPGAILERDIEEEKSQWSFDALHKRLASYREVAIKKAPSNAIVGRIEQVA